MNGQRLDLRLNLSPTNRHNPRAVSPRRSLTASPTSSCISSELSLVGDCDDDDDGPILRHSSSPEDTPMILVGCPRCFMYVMLTEEDPTCPKCKGTKLVDVFHDNTIITDMKATRANQ